MDSAGVEHSSGSTLATSLANAARSTGVAIIPLPDARGPRPYLGPLTASGCAGSSELYLLRDAHGDGYTNGMKTAVSVPDDVFDRAEALARRERRSRSEVYSAALREYVARHAPDEVTEQLDRVIAEVGETDDPFARGGALRILRATEW